ncbi:hypothetical protein [Acinetobacter wuhouensis]|uniref:Uncharacterized protein n=1 Tax=Acinetobacter wuhouensis TaxID=1879050 RepID=A0A4Q7AJP2_9GAMM|nr:hypothetical protein [Acinetobacter wuhouensis]RZG48992.1 hypothetical protein EXU28_01255 [Acinetobacter wuhouensis]
MNQVFYLVEELRKVKQLSTQLGGVESIVGWKKHLNNNNDLLVRQHVNVLENISLSLYESLKIEAEINGHNIYDQTWIHQTLGALSLQGMFQSNLSQISNQTLEYLRMTARAWQHGFEVKSALDEEKVSHLVTVLEEERAEIIKDDKLSFDLKRILVIELDKLIWALKKYSQVGDVLQGALKDFYGEVLLNSEVQKVFSDRPNLKDKVAEISSYVTIGTAAYQYMPVLLEKTESFLKLINLKD